MLDMLLPYSNSFTPLLRNFSDGCHNERSGITRGSQKKWSYTRAFCFASSPFPLRRQKKKQRHPAELVLTAVSEERKKKANEKRKH